MTLSHTRLNVCMQAGLDECLCPSLPHHYCKHQTFIKRLTEGTGNYVHTIQTKLNAHFMFTWTLYSIFLAFVVN